MFDLIKKILKNSDETKEDNKIEDAHLPLCVLLLEAAHVDGECSQEEMDHIVATLATECNVPKEDIEQLVDSANRQRNDSVDLFRFTRYMNQNFTREEKIAAMEAVWRIIHIDATLEAHEDHFAHKLANLLRLTHKDLIDAKIKARTQLS